MVEDRENALFLRDRLSNSVKIVENEGLGALFATVALDLLEAEKQSAYLQSMKLGRHLHAILANLQDCSTIAYRVNELSYVWTDTNVAARFLELDLTLFLTQVKAIYDYATEVINAIFDLPGNKRDHHRTKYAALVRYCRKSSEIEYFQSRLGNEIRRVAQLTCMFGLLTSIRDKLVHEGAKPSVTFDGDRVPYVQVISKQQQMLIPFKRFPENLRCQRLSNFVDLRAFITWMILELSAFLHQLGELVIIGLSTGKVLIRSFNAKVLFRYQRVVMDWIDQFEQCLSHSQLRPSYRRLQIPDSTSPVVLGSPLRYC